MAEINHYKKPRTTLLLFLEQKKYTTEKMLEGVTRSILCFAVPKGDEREPTLVRIFCYSFYCTVVGQNVSPQETELSVSK